MEILDRLAQVGEFDERLLELLGEVRTEHEGRRLTNYRRLAHYLVALTCHNKNLAMYKCELPDRGLRVRCLEEINRLLLEVARDHGPSREQAADLFLQHLKDHPHCHTSLISVTKLARELPAFLDTLLNMNLVFRVCCLFEFVAGKMFKVVLPTPRKETALAANLELHLAQLEDQG
jgi:hypothetical protein